MKNDLLTFVLWIKIIASCRVITTLKDTRNFISDIRSEYRVDYKREVTNEEIIAKAPKFLKWAYDEDNIFHEPWIYYVR